MDIHNTPKKLVSAALTLVIVAMLYLSGPGSAVSVLMSAISSLYVGQSVTIDATVQINTYEVVPILSSTLTITKPDSTTFSCVLPFPQNSTAISNRDVTCDNNQTIRVSATPSNNMDYSYGYGYWQYGYGYAYDYASGNYTYGYGYSYVTNYINGYSYDYGNYYWTANTYGYGGYGYMYDNATSSYGYYIGGANTNLTYSIKWGIPMGYSAGNYSAQITLQTSQINITALRTFVVSGLSALPRAARISEMLPNPNGSDTAAAPNGEWIELWNPGNSSVNVSGWYFTDSNGDRLTITLARTYTTNSTIIAANGYLVIYRNGATDFELDNDYDAITLYDNTDTVQDAVSYNANDFAYLWGGKTSAKAQATFPEGWSIILSPNGSWSATSNPTPGQANPGAFNVTVLPSAQTVNRTSPATNATYTIVINNTGSAATFNLTVANTNSADIAEVNQSSITLTAGAVGTIKLTVADAVAGTYAVSVNVTDGSSVETVSTTTTVVNVTMNTSVVLGWNLISISVTPDNASVDAVLSGVNYLVTYGWNASGQSFLSYMPGVIADFSQYEIDKGYWIYGNANGSSLANGARPVNVRDVLLYQGWNLVGYTSPTPVNVNDTLSGINYLVTYAWNASGQSFLSYMPGVIADFSQYTAGNGYWIYSNENKNWTRA